MSISIDKRGEVLATGLHFTDESLIVDLADGRTVIVPLNWYPRLVHATQKERENWETVLNGEGFHWPDLDEDLSVDGFVTGRPSGESERSFQRWLRAKKEGRGLTIPELDAHDEAQKQSTEESVEH